MGRQAPDGYLTFTQTLKRLGVSPPTLARYRRRGLLQGYQLESHRTSLFKEEDVQSLAESRRADLSTKQVRLVAMQALSIAKNNERQIGEIRDLMGMSVTVLDRTPEAMRSLYESASAYNEGARLTSVAWYRYWGGAIFAMDQTYLELLGEVLHEKQPWMRYVKLITTTMTRVATEEKDALLRSEPLRAAVRYMQSALTHLSYVAYLACANMHGRVVARRAFPDYSAVNELATLLD